MKPDEAAHAARAEMGSANAVKHHIRSGAWETVLENFWRDLWYGVRTLMRSPGFTAIAVLTLALGIGANTAIFQLLDAVRLRNLPVASPSELTVVRMANRSGWRGNQATDYPALNNPLWEYIRDHQHVFSQVLAWSPTNLGITEDDHERLVRRLVGEWKLLQCPWGAAGAWQTFRFLRRPGGVRRRGRGGELCILAEPIRGQPSSGRPHAHHRRGMRFQFWE